mmetsp:Transcript_25339/g.59120  ORF Transcript_25339/g.59120 Transcript_25339/m.59120 type:complete len:219 (+) Transcript_25339:357-1013(+)
MPPGVPSAFGLDILFKLAVRSAMNTERGMPLNSKKTSRVAALALSWPMATSLMPSVFPGSRSTEISSPRSIGSMNARVGSLHTSPYKSVSFLYCSNTFGYITDDMRSVSPIELPYLPLSSARAASRSSGGSDSPGRPQKTGSSFTTCDCSGCGKPPWGMPMAPWKNSTTEEGKLSVAACSCTAFSSRPLVTMNCAKSPTTLEEGVTLTMSPSSRLAAP